MAVTYHSSSNLFVGHLALAYAAKRWVPHLSLAVLFAAVQLADLIWPVLVAAGLERVRIAPGITAATPLEFISYPYSHSLLTLSVWGALFAFAVARLTSASAPDAPRAPVAPNAPMVLFALVVSHWVLDVVTHMPDMPLYPGGPKFGFGLWNSVAGTLLIELSMFTIGVWIYTRATAARDAAGRWGTWGLVAFLAIGFLATGTPPPSVTALWMSTLAGGAIILALAWWSDRHRTAVGHRR